MTKTIFCVFLMGVLTGCAGENDISLVLGTEKAPKERLAALASSDAMPKLNHGDTIAGTDANENGVRDDVEEFITSNYISSIQRAAVMQTAKAMQKALTVDKTDLSAVKLVDREISSGINCIYSAFNGANDSKQPAQVIQEIESITANTKQRLLAYLQFNKALDGTTTALPEGDTCK